MRAKPTSIALTLLALALLTLLAPAPGARAQDCRFFDAPAFPAYRVLTINAGEHVYTTYQDGPVYLWPVNTPFPPVAAGLPIDSVSEFKMAVTQSWYMFYDDGTGQTPVPGPDGQYGGFATFDAWSMWYYRTIEDWTAQFFQILNCVADPGSCMHTPGGSSGFGGDPGITICPQVVPPAGCSVSRVEPAWRRLFFATSVDVWHWYGAPTRWRYPGESEYFSFPAWTGSRTGGQRFVANYSYDVATGVGTDGWILSCPAPLEPTPIIPTPGPPTSTPSASCPAQPPPASIPSTRPDNWSLLSAQRYSFADGGTLETAFFIDTPPASDVIIRAGPPDSADSQDGFITVEPYGDRTLYTRRTVYLMSDFRSEKIKHDFWSEANEGVQRTLRFSSRKETESAYSTCVWIRSPSASASATSTPLPQAPTRTPWPTPTNRPTRTPTLTPTRTPTWTPIPTWDGQSLECPEGQLYIVPWNEDQATRRSIVVPFVNGQKFQVMDATIGILKRGDGLQILKMPGVHVWEEENGFYLAFMARYVDYLEPAWGGARLYLCPVPTTPTPISTATSVATREPWPTWPPWPTFPPIQIPPIQIPPIQIPPFPTFPPWPTSEPRPTEEPPIAATIDLPCVAPATIVADTPGPTPDLSFAIPTLAPLPTVVTATMTISTSGIITQSRLIVTSVVMPVQTVGAWSEQQFGPNGWERGQNDAAPIVAMIVSAFGWLALLSILGPLNWLLPPLFITLFVRIIRPILSVVKYVKQIIPFQ